MYMSHKKHFTVYLQYLPTTQPCCEANWKFSPRSALIRISLHSKQFSNVLQSLRRRGGGGLKILEDLHQMTIIPVLVFIFYWNQQQTCVCFVYLCMYIVHQHLCVLVYTILPFEVSCFFTRIYACYRILYQLQYSVKTTGTDDR